MKNRTSLILFLVLIFCACKKEDKPYVPVQRCPDKTRNLDTINLYIHATWEWVEEKQLSREYGVQYFTPNSPGWGHRALKISGDTIKLFKNNQPDSIYRFKIQRELEITNYPTDSMPCIVYYRLSSNQLTGYVPIMICRSQLLMQLQFVSSFGGERLWIRK